MNRVLRLTLGLGADSIVGGTQGLLPQKGEATRRLDEKVQTTPGEELRSH